MTSLLRCACSGIVTVFVTPWSVRLPVALIWIGSPSAGTDPSWIGCVSTNVAFGNRAVSMAWVRIALSRRASSGGSVVMSTSNDAFGTTSPAIVIVPVTFGVRPTAVFAPMPASSSCTRNPANELVKSLNVPIVWSTFHVPSRPARFDGGPPVVAVVSASLPSRELAARSMLTSAGASSRKTKYHVAPPATTRATTAASAMSHQRFRIRQSYRRVAAGIARAAVVLSGGSQQQIAREEIDTVAPAQRHRPPELLGEVAEDGDGAVRARDRQPPQHRAADHHRLGAQRDGSEHIDAAADPAVDVDLGPALDRVDDLGQDVGRGRHAVEG